MKKLWMLFVVLFLLVACGGNSAEPAATNEETMSNETEMMDKPEETMAGEGEMMEEHPTEETMSGEGEMMEKPEESMAGEGEMMDHPAWQIITLTDVRTNETFTFADFAGKTVFVEPMATWCTNCRQQLTHVQAARAQLNDENVVFVALSVETSIDNATLAEYTVDTGFDWMFAVATPELLQELAGIFGQTITNPPSTPHFIIRPDGTTTDLVTGIETADQLIAQLQAVE